MDYTRLLNLVMNISKALIFFMRCFYGGMYIYIYIYFFSYFMWYNSPLVRSSNMGLINVTCLGFFIYLSNNPYSHNTMAW
jgi:hypothetical protein